jgi:hypothetical protein
MLSEFLIAVLVVLLGGYWFRYNCLSILRTRTSHARAQQVAEANQLSFPGAARRLASEVSAAELDGLKEALLRDYTVLTCLLRYTAATAFTLEQRMLVLDFHCMQLRYSFTHRYSAGQARRSLMEATRILNHFASTVGERSATMMRV